MAVTITPSQLPEHRNGILAEFLKEESLLETR